MGVLLVRSRTGFFYKKITIKYMLDLKVLKSALEQLEEERRIPKEKILEAIELALAAAYKKDYGKRDQIIRTSFDTETGAMVFSQIKIVVDDSTVRMPDENGEFPEVEPFLANAS